MNNLKGTRAYLCGAMTFDSNQVVWREKIGKILKGMGVMVLDPTNKPIDIGLEKMEDQYRRTRLKISRDYDTIAAEMKVIRCVDLRMVDISDFIIVNVDIEKYTVGTWEEVSLGNRQKKPIIFRIEQGKQNTPDWLFGMVPHQMIFSTWKQVIGYLSMIDDGSYTNTYKRWYLFNFNKE